MVVYHATIALFYHPPEAITIISSGYFIECVRRFVVDSDSFKLFCNFGGFVVDNDNPLARLTVGNGKRKAKSEKRKRIFKNHPLIIENCKMKRSDSVATLLTIAHNALGNCHKSKNTVWGNKWEAIAELLERDGLPSGSGIDSGSKIVSVTDSKIVINCSYHCMDENGFYCGWRDYRITLRAAFNGAQISVTGRDYNGLKDYLAELYHFWLNESVNDFVWDKINEIKKSA